MCSRSQVATGFGARLVAEQKAYVLPAQFSSVTVSRISTAPQVAIPTVTTKVRVEI